MRSPTRSAAPRSAIGLLVTGAGLQLEGMFRPSLAASVAVFLKLILMPVLAIALALWFGLVRLQPRDRRRLLGGAGLVERLRAGPPDGRRRAAAGADHHAADDSGGDHDADRDRAGGLTPSFRGDAVELRSNPGEACSPRCAIAPRSVLAHHPEGDERSYSAPRQPDALHRRRKIVEAVQDDRQPGRVGSDSAGSRAAGRSKTPRRRRTSHTAGAARSTPATTAGWRRATFSERFRPAAIEKAAREKFLRDRAPRRRTRSPAATARRRPAPISARRTMKPGATSRPSARDSRSQPATSTTSAPMPIARLRHDGPAQRQIVGERRARQPRGDPQRRRARRAVP